MRVDLEFGTNRITGARILLAENTVAGAVLIIAPSAWLVASLLGTLFPDSGIFPWITTVSFVAVGLLVALQPHLTKTFITGCASGLGALHGFINGTSVAAEGGDQLSLLGTTVSVFVLLALLTAVVVGLRAEWTRIAVRVAGSWIVAIGLLMLGWLLRS